MGWLHLPSSITPEFLNEIQAVANTLREKCEVVVVAGIGSGIDFRCGITTARTTIKNGCRQKGDDKEIFLHSLNK